MSTSKKLSRNRTAAEVSSLTGVLSRLDPTDYFGRVGIESRLQELQQQVAQDDPVGDVDTSASAALFFGGGPVVGSAGIESGFAGAALNRFQDLVAKLALEDRGPLGQRGPLPAHEDAKLHVTGVLRGSFGFMLEELRPDASLLDTTLKVAVTRATQILEAFSDVSEEAFEEALDATDQRSAAAAREFFSLLGANNATLRLETSSHSLEIARPAIERAADRAITSRVDETIEERSGRLLGLLPSGHMFDLEIDGQVLTGRVSKSISEAQLADLLATHLNQQVEVRLLVRKIFRRDDLSRQTYILQELRGATVTGVGLPGA